MKSQTTLPLTRMRVWNMGTSMRATNDECSSVMFSTATASTPVWPGPINIRSVADSVEKYREPRRRWYRRLSDAERHARRTSAAAAGANGAA